MKTVAQEIAGVYEWLRHPGQAKLKKSFVYKAYQSVLAQCYADLEISRNNQQLLRPSAPFTASARESQIEGLPPLAQELGVEYRPLTSTSEADWLDLPLKDATDISTAAGYGVHQLAIYGTPKTFYFSFDPTPYSFRVWFSPAENLIPAEMDADVGLSETFSAMREIQTALLCLADCGFAEEKKRDIEGALLKAESYWLPRWQHYVEQKPHRAASRRRAQNEDRRRLRRGY